MSACVVALSVSSHQAAHVLAGTALGGYPGLLTGTDVGGDWSRLSELQLLLFGAIGPLANAVLALAGWLLARRGLGRPRLGTLIGWVTFALNGWMGVGYLIVSAALGVGDWIDVLDAFPNRGPTRISMIVTGLFIAGLLWNETVATLSQLVGNGGAPDRSARAMGITRTAWLTSGLVVVASALFAPVEVPRSVLIAIGATMGTTWPMVLAARGVAALPVPGLPLDLPRRSSMLILAGIVTVAFVIGLGRGLDLAG